MAWVVPTNQNIGDLITSDIWNQNVVANPNALYALTDDLYNLPACRAYNSANISITTATETALTFNSERFDNDNIHSTTVDTGRLTCVTAGVYHIFFNFQFATNGAGLRYVRFRVDGTTTIAAARQAPDATGVVNSIETAMQLHTNYKLAVAQYVEVLVYQNSGGGLNIEYEPQWSPEFGMVWQSLG